jgi:glucosyl-3-phosphoglycerate synthase
VAAWFARRTWQPPPWTIADLASLKGDRTVSVVLPALNEERTVAGVVAAVRPHTRPARPGGAALVDEIVVVDGGSGDATAARARAAGARVVDRATALPGVEVAPGKGEVLWRSLAATRGDVLAFLDADLVDVGPDLVPALLGPILAIEGIHLVKGFYRRPLRLETVEAGTGGGRVTELVARPLLARFAPLLSGVIQPLGGEYAGTREALEQVPFAAAYGVEIGLLMDVADRFGLDAIGQVDLGVRKHRNRTLLELGPMAQQVLDTVLARAGVGGGAVDLIQYVQTGAGWQPRRHRVALADRPPMADVRAAAADPAAMARSRGDVVPAGADDRGGRGGDRRGGRSPDRRA